MGSGNHGGFGKTYGSVAAGDAIYKSEPSVFFANIANRKDIDKNGFYDVVAHGGATIMQITHNGETIEIDSRTAAKLLKRRSDYKRRQPLRLLSCDTGSSTIGFAQNLANKLNVVVEAPTKLVWAYPNGTYFVAGRRKDNPNLPDMNNPGVFRKFYPGGKKR